MAETKDSAKELGAYYTDTRVADFLVWWAFRSGADTVMDPSFGDGVFLRAAYRRIASMNGQPSEQLFGIEIDQDVWTKTRELLAAEFEAGPAALVLNDFFEIEPSSQPVDAIVGNPPFIRYQRFSGQRRERALQRAAEQNVRLTKLASSWAPFLVHSIAMLKPGGRLGMVIPFEIGHATYAQPILAFLYTSFGCVTFLTFREKLFPQLSQDTLLILAEDKGAGGAQFQWRDLARVDRLDSLMADGQLPLTETRPLEPVAITTGEERLIEHFIPEEAHALYNELRRHNEVYRLGDLADVGIGYVTGANDFFHLSPTDAKAHQIPEEMLRPAVQRSGALLGLRFTQTDWRRAVKNGQAGYLLHINAQADLSENVRRYITAGEAQGVNTGYKCRNRSPWYSVPHVYQPDGFLSYMSGHRPSLVANEAGVVAPNTLNILRVHPLTMLSGESIAAMWQTSLTRLSTEIEGHPLGGGMLKLEPAEASKVLVAAYSAGNERLLELAEELDNLLRSGEIEQAQTRADAAILQQGLGLTEEDCRLLTEAAKTLRNRRNNKLGRTDIGEP